MTIRWFAGVAVGLLISTLADSTTLTAQAEGPERYLARFGAEAELLRDVAGVAPPALQLQLLDRFQDRVLGDRSRFAGWSAEDMSRLYELYVAVWKTLSEDTGSTRATAEQADRLKGKHAQIRRALGRVSGPDVLKAMADRLEKGEAMSAVLADGVKQLEGMDFHADAKDAASPAAVRIYQAAASWVTKWALEPGAGSSLAELGRLKRFAVRVPPPASTLDEALLGLADRAAAACLSADPTRLEAYREFNPLIDAIRDSGLVRDPGRLDTSVKARFSFIPRSVDRSGLIMTFAEADAVARRKDVVQIQRAILEAVQYFDANRKTWIQPEVSAASRERDPHPFYLLPARTFRLRYRLEAKESGKGVPTSAWLVHAEQAGPNTSVDVLLPESGIRNCFYHLTLKRRACWVSEKCWTQADALKHMKAHHERLGDEGRAKARHGFHQLWNSAGGSPADLDHAALKELFAKVEYDRSFASRPFHLDQSFSEDVRGALIELFNVDSNILNTPGHGGAQLPGRQLARELLRLESVRGQGIRGLVNSSCQKTASAEEKSGRTVGICTVVAMEKKGQDR